jgi:hypothetical protein
MVTKVETPHHPPLYRVWQFIQALTARRLTPTEWLEVSSFLTPPQQRLFRRMETNDQRHSLQVLHTLAREGETCHDLLVAALLHDVGKSRHPLRLWERPIVVLIRLFRPAMVMRWGRQTGDQEWGWKRPFIIYEQHPAWGAQMATTAGCSPLTVWLIRWHQERPAAPYSVGPRQTAGRRQGGMTPSGQDESEQRLLQALQRADSEN